MFSDVARLLADSEPAWSWLRVGTGLAGASPEEETMAVASPFTGSAVALFLFSGIPLPIGFGFSRFIAGTVVFLAAVFVSVAVEVAFRARGMVCAFSVFVSVAWLPVLFRFSVVFFFDTDCSFRHGS
ncbi:hypothetical protein [Bacteroides heparinolyticus]|uniref:hypothetical protein n=1 Tax=Prevotella heparinolytica TaxID=28113 RepID=UPI0023F35738|nr:hypothetical protein [Bacteroides heparinolyticus]